jgi:hypothetical protein
MQIGSIQSSPLFGIGNEPRKVMIQAGDADESSGSRPVKGTYRTASRAWSTLPILEARPAPTVEPTPQSRSACAASADGFESETGSMDGSTGSPDGVMTGAAGTFTTGDGRAVGAGMLVVHPRQASASSPAATAAMLALIEPLTDEPQVA